MRTRTGANNAEITKHYAGVMDSERMWRTDFGSNGSSHYFEGEMGAEHKVRIEFANGAVQHYEGGRGAERLVRSTYASAGSGVQHFEGPKGMEKLVRHEWPNGTVAHFEGQKGAERKVRTVYKNGRGAAIFTTRARRALSTWCVWCVWEMALCITTKASGEQSG